MMRALWFFARLGVLIAVVLWLVEHRGHVSVEWGEYVIDANTDVLTVFFLAVLFSFAVLYHTWRRFISIPEAYRKYRQEKRRTQGYEAITKGLLALAIGDADDCAKQAGRAKLLLPDTALTFLLLAQASALKGDRVKAHEYFTKLASRKDGEFFGIRGLLSDALQRNDKLAAMSVVRHAYELEPKRAWILKTLFNLEIDCRHWEEARVLCIKAGKNGIMDKQTSAKNHAAILLAMADEWVQKNNLEKALSCAQTAVKVCPDFVPAVIQCTRLYLKNGYGRKAVKLLKSAWKTNPHHEFIREWKSFISLSLSSSERLKKLEEITSVHPYNVESLIFKAQLALDSKLWGMARGLLSSAIERGADKRAFDMMARLEKEGFGDAGKAEEWYKNAESRSLPQRWVCKNTGASFQEWQAVCPIDGSFNSMEWTIPLTGIEQKGTTKNISGKYAAYGYNYLTDSF